MANQKYQEIQGLSIEELNTELAELQEEYQKLQFDHATTGLDNPLVIRERRREIARVKTELRKREMGEMSEAQLAKRSKIRQRRSKK